MTMTEEPKLPRTLALRLLGMAQQAGESGIQLALLPNEHGEPDDWVPLDQKPADDIVPWAYVLSARDTLPPPTRSDAQIMRLLVALDIKGVLRLSAWIWRGERWVERPISITD